MHNKREHLQGKQHLQSVAGDITKELASNTVVINQSTLSLNTSLDESSLDSMPKRIKMENSKNEINEAMKNLTAMVLSK